MLIALFGVFGEKSCVVSVSSRRDTNTFHVTGDHDLVGNDLYRVSAIISESPDAFENSEFPSVEDVVAFNGDGVMEVIPESIVSSMKEL